MIDLNDARPQWPDLKAEHWPAIGWVIIDDAARIDCDEDGNLDFWSRLFAHGFQDESDARLWLAVFKIIHDAGGKVSGRQDYHWSGLYR